ncbi:RluA family pseudouridine synthase [Anthocerotibacter panamensis]|uniref:RluA family pseudouridine synthase n=1 Tax=Anthocerotibacter panamensis TaxID=2857077 RepID=UPI001C402195|nr:RluA family pseudouridine synthase [Anthocerotibacter panamensis]
MNQGWTYQEQVAASAQGWTVLAYYTRHYRHSSPEEWEERILAGAVLLDGAPTTATTLLTSGQILSYRRPPWQEPPVPLHFTVVYADSQVMVVAKPSGLPVLPGGGFLENTLLGQLKIHYPDRTPLPIHRLGRGTSGLVLLACSAEARADLSQQFREHRLHKVYRALAKGTGMPDTFTVTQPIGRIPHAVLGHIWAANPDGLPALSSCRVLHRGLETTLLEVAITTGRPHQIRIHLATYGYPLLGDPLYPPGGVPYPTASEGELPVPGDCGYHLHAQYLSFRHPVTSEVLHLTCPPPPALAL